MLHLQSAWLDSSKELMPASAAKSIVPSSFVLVIATIASRAAITNAFTFTIVADSGLIVPIVISTLTNAVAIEGPKTRAAVAVIGQALNVDRELEKRAVTPLAGLGS